VVVRGDILSLNIVLNTALGAIYPPWRWPGVGITSPATGLLIFPPAVQPNLVTLKSFFSHGTTLSTIPYSIGYMWQDEANNLGIPYASLKNPTTGAIITANADSVLFAVMEKGGTPLVQSVLSLLDMTAPTGPSAWPFACWSFLIVRTTTFRQTCAIKNAMVIILDSSVRR
jgi:hypothetical protein